jgi:putative ABC transport system permease protein
MIAALTAVFAGLAALLAAVGLYGVLAYAVSRRVRELGVRMALGAERADVVGLVTRQGLALVAIGLAIGLGVAVAGGRVMESLLFRLDARDPLSMAAAGLFLLAVATAACLIPAWRATRVSPSEALREE